MSGTAELNVDYDVETSAEGEESLLVDVTNNYNLYNKMGVLDDGRIVGLSGSHECYQSCARNFVYLYFYRHTISSG